MRAPTPFAAFLLLLIGCVGFGVACRKGPPGDVVACTEVTDAVIDDVTLWESWARGPAMRFVPLERWKANLRAGNRCTFPIEAEIRWNNGTDRYPDDFQRQHFGPEEEYRPPAFLFDNGSPRRLLEVRNPVAFDPSDPDLLKCIQDDSSLENAPPPATVNVQNVQVGAKNGCGFPVRARIQWIALGRHSGAPGLDRWPGYGGIVHRFGPDEAWDPPDAGAQIFHVPEGSLPKLLVVFEAERGNR